MNSFQQLQMLKPMPEEKDETTTQADTFFGEEPRTFLDTLPMVKEEVLRHHAICGRISEGTFSSDKLLRLLSALLKLTRTYNLTANLKPVEKLSAEVGQLRRLLRCDRLLMIFKEYVSLGRKGRLSKMDKFMAVFKAMILLGDLSDLLAFLVQLRVSAQSQLLPALKKNVANIYFLECLGWLCYHVYEYRHSKDEEGRQKNKMMIYKYLLDSLTSHNDFSARTFTLDPRLCACLALASSILNLSLVWK